jgi:hypothetical protein
MNTKNLEFLQEGLKYLGFDAKLNLELARNLQAQTPAFSLQAETTHFKDTMQATLHFRKSDNSDLYFFNKYEAKLNREDGVSRQQTFYINKNAGITFKEAYNLLSGRAVNKDLVNKSGERYNAWVQLDFSKKDKHDNNAVKQYTANYGYDMAGVVSRYPIKELSDEQQKEKLLRSLAKGNLQSVTFEKDGQTERMFIEANPQFKSVNVFDAHMKKMYQENTKDQQVHKEGTAVKQPATKKRSAKMTEEKNPAKTRNTRKGMKM